MRRKLSLTDYALWLLGAREYTVKRLREKCVERYSDQLDEVENLIKKFVQNKYLDDERFCEVMIRSEINKGNGRVKIQQKLIQKGIAPDLAKQKVAELVAVEDQLAPAQILADKKKQQIEKKYPDLNDYERRAKLTQYLAGRGYDFDLIKQILA